MQVQSVDNQDLQDSYFSRKRVEYILKFDFPSSSSSIQILKKPISEFFFIVDDKKKLFSLVQKFSTDFFWKFFCPPNQPQLPNNLFSLTKIRWFFAYLPHFSYIKTT